MNLVLEVQGPDGPPYEVQMQVVVSLLDVGACQPGATVDVRIDPKNRNDVVVLFRGSRTARRCAGHRHAESHQWPISSSMIIWIPDAVFTVDWLAFAAADAAGVITLGTLPTITGRSGSPS